MTRPPFEGGVSRWRPDLISRIIGRRSVPRVECLVPSTVTSDRGLAARGSQCRVSITLATLADSLPARAAWSSHDAWDFGRCHGHRATVRQRQCDVTPTKFRTRSLGPRTPTSDRKPELPRIHILRRVSQIPRNEFKYRPVQGICTPREEICSNLCLISSSLLFAKSAAGTFLLASLTLSQISRPSGLSEDVLTRRTRRSDWQ